MKSRLISVILAVLLLVTVVLTATACSFPPSTYITNIKGFKPLKYVDAMGNESKNLRFIGDYRGDIDLVFGAEVEINAVMIRDANSATLEFGIYDVSSGEPISIYEQDYVDDMRICNFPPIKVTRLRIQIKECKSKFNITEIKCFYDDNVAPADFIRASGISIDDVMQSDNIDKDKLLSLNKITISDAAIINVNGGITYNSGLTTAIVNIKEIFEEKEQALQLIMGYTFSNRGNSLEVQNGGIRTALTTHAESLAKEMSDKATGLNVDGSLIDWDYPSSSTDYTALGKFATIYKGIDKAHQLGVSINGNKVSLKRDYVNNIDYFDLRAYRKADWFGNHGGYTTAAAAIDMMAASKIPLNKIILTIPSFGLFNEAGAVPVPYYADELLLVEMTNYMPIMTAGVINNRHYNGIVLVYDKVRLAVAVELGGVGLSHYGYDLAYNHKHSLLAAISRASQ